MLFISHLTCEQCATLTCTEGRFGIRPRSYSGRWDHLEGSSCLYISLQVFWWLGDLRQVVAIELFHYLPRPFVTKGELVGSSKQ